jgi:hypothetical protein
MSMSPARHSASRSASSPSEDAPSANGVAGLRSAELTALLHSSPTANLAASHALAPYLLDTPGLSPGAYNEWLTRVCEQPDD